jgi:hypothetical protein
MSEECEGHHEDYVFRGRAKRLLVRAWIFPLRRNLTPFNMRDCFFHRSVLISNNDNLYGCANGINDAKYAYNNLQEYDLT